MSDLIKIPIEFIFKTIFYMVLSLVSIILSFNLINLLILGITLASIQYCSVNYPHDNNIQITAFIIFIAAWRTIGKNFYNRGEKEC